MRPPYETHDDLQNEQIIAAHYLAALHRKDKLVRTVRKLPASYRLDFAIETEGKINAWLEVKDRRTGIPFSGGPDTLILSALKWQTGSSLAQTTGLAFVVLVRFSDGIVGSYRQYSRPPPETKWGGRTVLTRDSADVEPVVHLPLISFENHGMLPRDDLVE